MLGSTLWARGLRQPGPTEARASPEPNEECVADHRPGNASTRPQRCGLPRNHPVDWWLLALFRLLIHVRISRIASWISGSWRARTPAHCEPAAHRRLQAVVRWPVHLLPPIA